MMKIVLTGSTGFIGGEILARCVAHLYISHVYVLTRRPLDDRFSHKKVTQILQEDYEQWPEDLMVRLRDEGVEACIWALGGRSKQFRDIETARKIGITYPIAAAEAFAKYLAAPLLPYAGYPDIASPPPGSNHFPFRFVYVSGWGAEHNEFRRLWVANDDRKIKGAAEKGLFEVASKSDERNGHRCFEAISLRPGGVLPAGDGIMTIMTEAVLPSIGVDRLAKAAVRVALEGADGMVIVENKALLGEDWAEVNTIPH